MGENSTIEWTDHTHNPWIGCTIISPGCTNCYAKDLMERRYGRVVWGPRGERSLTAEANRRKPFGWNRAAQKAGRHARVFCASLADVFDDHPSIRPEWRAELFATIEATPWLDWQLLTKRPENVMAMVPEHWRAQFPPNVQIGTSVENQKYANERILQLLRIPARVRFLSCEPLLSRVELGLIGTVPREISDRPVPLSAMLHWVIVGGESGPGAREFNIAWARAIVAECRGNGVPVFVKQLGALPTVLRNTPSAKWPDSQTEYLVQLRDKKGGDMSEWPEDLRVREMPTT